MTEYKIPINPYLEYILKRNGDRAEIFLRCCGWERYLFSVKDFDELLPLARLILLIAKGYRNNENERETMGR